MIETRTGRRMLASLNSCNGFALEALEGGALADLIEAAWDILGALDRAADGEADVASLLDTSAPAQMRAALKALLPLRNPRAALDAAKDALEAAKESAYGTPKDSPERTQVAAAQAALHVAVDVFNAAQVAGVSAKTSG